MERYNRTLLQLIRCYRQGNLDTWDENLQILAGALRATRNRQTGYTPNMLMLGREVLLPVDVLTGSAMVNQESANAPEYVSYLRSALARVHALARNALQSAQAVQKRDYDIKTRARSYEPGDLVYELNSAMKVGQCRKLQPIWKGPFLVVEVLSPVLFRIRDRKAKDRVVHHDRLKPCHDRFIPLWMRRMRHRWVQTMDDMPQEDSFLEPALEKLDPEAGEDSFLGPALENVDTEAGETTQVQHSRQMEPDVKKRGDRTEACLRGLPWLFRDPVPLDPPVKPAFSTRTGRVVRQPHHLQDNVA